MICMFSSDVSDARGSETGSIDEFVVPVWCVCYKVLTSPTIELSFLVISFDCVSYVTDNFFLALSLGFVRIMLVDR